MRPDARPGRFLRLRVADTGIGMDTATLGRIFEPFFTTKEVGKGTGLGLATVYGIVKQHEGWIEVNSEPDKGSMFDVFFPISEQPLPPEKIEAAAPAPVTGGHETILLVEDEEILREMARDILKNCGYRLFEAATGKEALKLWSECGDKIDLLLTDMVMPEGISGVELAERLLADRPDLKIIFTSGYTSSEINAGLMARIASALPSKTLLAHHARQDRSRLPGPNRGGALTPHGQSRVWRHDRRHFERHPLCRPRRTRPRRRIRVSTHRQSPASCSRACLPASGLDAPSAGSGTATGPFSGWSPAGGLSCGQWRLQL